MNFKKPKQQVAQDAANRAQNIIMNSLSVHNNGNVGGIGYSITTAISDGIKEAILSMMDDMYTDQEFEEDIGLRDKK